MCRVQVARAAWGRVSRWAQQAGQTAELQAQMAVAPQYWAREGVVAPQYWAREGVVAPQYWAREGVGE